MRLDAAIALLGVMLLPACLLYAQEKSLSRAEIEQIIREYILQHPEVLIDSVRAHQQRERTAAQQKSRDAVIAKRRELFEDATSPVAGKPGAGVAIVQFFDYNCGYCRRVAPTLTKLLEQEQKVHLIFKELPILGPDSHIAAQAALAAAKQGAYIPFHQALMGLKSPATMAAIEETGRKLRLDIDRLKADMNSTEVRAILAQNQRLAREIGVESTPSFVIGNEVVPGAMDLAAFQALIAKAAEEKAVAPAAPLSPTPPNP
ncbi:MAG: DsbA family protein [Bryobacteraceae bacterium]|nr:DsbA family protein [Bryobacterales bacterium]MEB2360153.1 DsbA family protein [Bryobacterales bacterium]NUM99736.1 DsbA family protein [Bryobacteraceae bacterium]